MTDDPLAAFPEARANPRLRLETVRAAIRSFERRKLEGEDTSQQIKDYARERDALEQLLNPVRLPASPRRRPAMQSLTNAQWSRIREYMQTMDYETARKKEKALRRILPPIAFHREKCKQEFDDSVVAEALQWTRGAPPREPIAAFTSSPRH